MINKIDGAILSFFAKFSHRFQRLTGRTNFFLARLCLTFMSMSILLDFGNYWFPLLSKSTNIFWIFVQIALAFMVSKDLSRCDHAEKNAYASEEQTKMRFAISGDAFYRVFVMLFLIISLHVPIRFYIGLLKAKTSIIFDLLDWSFIPALAAGQYFVEVTPLPPGKSKLRQWMEFLFTGFRKPLPAGAEK